MFLGTPYITLENRILDPPQFQQSHVLIFVISRNTNVRACPETDGPTIVSACFAPRCVNLAAFPRSNDGHSVTDRIFRARSQFTLARWARFPDDGFLDRMTSHHGFREIQISIGGIHCERKRERTITWIQSQTREQVEQSLPWRDIWRK